MVGVYCTLIRTGRRSFDSVPDDLKDKVEAKLKEQGYDVYGKPLK